jgi:flagellar FliJ protein
MAIKQFKFRLQRVLDYREIVKTERLGVLTEATRLLREAEAKLQALEAEANANTIQESGLVSGNSLYLHGLYAQGVRRWIEETRGKVAELEIKREAALQEYIAASKDVRALELLKQKKMGEYDAKILAFEAGQLDELAVQRAARGIE